jgi:hydrogenase small subunit
LFPFYLNILFNDETGRLAMGTPEDLSDGLWPALERRDVSRRRFLRFCSAMTATLALPMSYTGRIVQALETVTRPSIVWLEFQDCAGNSEAALRAAHPTFADIVLDLLSWNYHETVMVPSGHAAEKSLEDTVKNEKGKYIAVVEGSIPLAEGGVYCTIGGRTAQDIATEVCKNAYATIALGTCATFGGLPAARGGVTGAVSVQQAVPGLRIINLSGCPANGQNLAAALVHYLTFKELPAADGLGRPLFAHGDRIHDLCPRRAHFDAGQFVREWGDEGHRLGWCLYKMGCKGPAANYNCPNVQFNGGTNWPIGVGHGCVGCAAPDFWDRMSPFYSALPNVNLLGAETTAEGFGTAIVATVAGLTAAHAVGSAIRLQRNKAAKLAEAKNGAVVAGGNATKVTNGNESMATKQDEKEAR